MGHVGATYVAPGWSLRSLHSTSGTARSLASAAGQRQAPASLQVRARTQDFAQQVPMLLLRLLLLVLWPDGRRMFADHAGADDADMLPAAAEPPEDEQWEDAQDGSDEQQGSGAEAVEDEVEAGPPSASLDSE